MLEAFLKVDGITSESLAKTHTGEIELQDWRWVGENPATTTGSGLSSGKVQVNDLCITKRIDKASPQLLAACFAGKHIASVSLSVCKSGGKSVPEDFLTIGLTDAMVTSVASRPDQVGSDNAEAEDVTFAFSALEFTYKQQKADGTFATAGNMKYDVKTRTVS